MASGLYTTDNVATSQLYTELARDITLYNKQEQSFLERFCKRTTQKTVRVTQQAQRFKKAGRDMDEPQWDRHVYRDIDLTAPVPYQLSSGFTKLALEEGVSSAEIRDLQADAIAADQRLLQETVLKSMLNDGGFWDASMSLAPPSYRSNTFLTTHDHYLAASVSGTIATTHVTDAKQHIQEHGYGLDGGLVAFINSAQAELLENVAALTNNYMPTPTISQLQSQGVIGSVGTVIAGVPLVVNDWIPAYYMLVVDLNTTPCRWRDVEGTGTGLITDTEDDFLKNLTKYRRWVSSTVVHKGAGVCYYLNSGTWTDPTGWTI